MIIKKIGTSQLGKSGGEADRTGGKREDETTSLETLRTSLGSGNTLGRGILLEGRYEVEQVIGYGGMSTVYRARDTRFSQTVRVCAVKEMFDISTDPNVRQDKLKRFEEEANFLALLNHPSIPQIFDFFPANERRYLVLEFIEGKNLETLLEERGAPFEEKQVLEWAVTLCEVLAYLHNHKPKPIVFRDMKPSNVMVREDGRLVLIDFGIAKNFQSEKGTMIGTEGYSPPEQYKGLALQGGDIYALGATMHQLLTNSDPRVEIPFTFHERLPQALNPKISLQAQTVIMKALEFDIARRYASVEDFRAALLNVLGRNETASPTLSSASAVSLRPAIAGVGTRDLNSDYERGTGLNFQTSGIAAARSAGVTGINPTTAGFLRPGQTEEAPTSSNPRRGPGGSNSTLALGGRQRGTASVEPETIGPPEDLPIATEVWNFACEEEVRSSPIVHNGVLYVGCYDSNLYALDARNGSFLWKSPTQAGVCATPCIADKAVVIGSEDGSLYAFETIKGQQVWSVRTGGPIRGSARFYAPMVFFGSGDQHIYCVEARTGKVVWKQRTWQPILSTPTIVAGIVYIASTDRHLYALDGNTGNVKWRFQALEPIVSSPLVQDNFVFIGSQDGHLYAIDTSTSWPLWKFKTGNLVNSSPAYANGKVYVGSVDGYLYCLEAKNGKLLWKFNTGHQVTSSPKVADGTVYFGGVDGNVYALDAEKGTPRWFYPTEGSISSSPAIENGIVYIGSNDNHVYALNAK